MKHKKKIYLGGGLLAVLVIVAVVFTGGGKEVETMLVEKGSIIRTVVDSGYVQPATAYDLHATQSARVLQVPVETGQSVTKGQPLMVMENLDLSVQISDVSTLMSQAVTAAEGARAALKRSELELLDTEESFNRLQELYQAGAISRVEFDNARLLVETTRQNVSEQRARLDSAMAQEAGLSQSLKQLTVKAGQLVLRSPADGTVLSLPVRQEQVVNPGSLLAVVAMSGKLEVKADILSDDLGEVKVGQRAVVTAPVLGEKSLEGEVVTIYPRAEEKQSALGIIQRRVPVIIALEDRANLKPGYEVRVAIETSSRNDVPVLPRESVRTVEGGHKEVMVVVNKQVQYRTVETGISDYEKIEIVKGLEAGEQVIKDGSLDLADKSKVKPLPQAD